MASEIKLTPIGMDDVGRTITVGLDYDPYHSGYAPTRSISVLVTMGIRTPKGQMFLFDGGSSAQRARAVRTFMRQHKTARRHRAQSRS